MSDLQNCKIYLLSVPNQLLSSQPEPHLLSKLGRCDMMTVRDGSLNLMHPERTATRVDGARPRGDDAALRVMVDGAIRM